MMKDSKAQSKISKKKEKTKQNTFNRFQENTYKKYRIYKNKY